MFILRAAPRLRPYIYIGGILFLAVWVVLSGINRKTVVQQVEKRDSLRVVTLATPLSMHQEDGENYGYEYQLTKEFAEFLGVKLKIVYAEDRTQLFQILASRNVDLAAGALHQHPKQTIGKVSTTGIKATSGYRESKTLVIYRKTQGLKPARKTSDLTDSLVIALQDSAESHQLLRLKESANFTTDLFDEINHLDLMTLLQNREADYALVPEDLFLRVRSYHPELAIAFKIEEPLPAVWYFRDQSDKSLEQKLVQFFARPATKALISKLDKDSTPPKNPLNFIESHAFRTAIEERYEELAPYFKEAELESGLDDLLLAAAGYQESHWREDAKSHTGVRGIMMLTKVTAAEVGIDDRTDARDSILGGARYLVKVEQKIPDRIPEPDRFWLAMAGYNIGFGHLEDARKLAQRAGLNPDKWSDVAKHLPRLEDKKVAAKTTYGEARGSEAVTYVSNIQHYLTAIDTYIKLNQLRSIHLEPL